MVGASGLGIHWKSDTEPALCNPDIPIVTNTQLHVLQRRLTACVTSGEQINHINRPAMTPPATPRRSDHSGWTKMAWPRGAAEDLRVKQFNGIVRGPAKVK